MTNNRGKRVKTDLGIKANIIIPRVPSTVMLDGGGQIATKALDNETLSKIADLWKAEFIAKARA